MFPLCVLLVQPWSKKLAVLLDSLYTKYSLSENEVLDNRGSTNNVKLRDDEMHLTSPLKVGEHIDSDNDDEVIVHKAGNKHGHSRM
jgi:hypothetical protein